MAHVGSWRYEVATGGVTWSPEVFRIYGVDPVRFVPSLDNGLAFYDPSDQQAILDKLAEAVENRSGYELQLGMNRADGERREVIARARCEVDSAGNVAAVIGVFQDVTDFVRAMRTAQQSEARYRVLADSMGDVISRIAFDGTGHYVSPAVTKVLGYQPEGLRPPFRDYVHPDDRASVEEAVNAVRDGRGACKLRHRVRHANGHYLWVESSYERAEANAFSGVAVVTVMRDVTERHEMEQALARSEERYRTLAEASSDIIVRVGRDSRIRYVNEACRRLGYAPDDVIGLPILTFVTGESLPHSAKTVDDLFAGLEIDPEVRREHQVRTADGRLLWLEGSPSLIRNDQGDVVEYITIFRDITARRSVQDALERSEARFRRLAHTAPDVIVEMNVEAVMTFVSPAALAITGFGPSHFVGRSLLEFIAPAHAQIMRRMLDGVVSRRADAEPWPVEFTFGHRDGRELWLEAKATPSFDGAGAVAGYTAIIKDITANKKLIGALSEAHAAAERAASIKAEFMANMSHELRTPLTAMLGFARLASEQPGLDPQTRLFTHRAVAAGKALQAIVNDILDFSKLEAGQVEIRRAPASPAHILAETVQLFEQMAADRGLSLALEGVDGLPLSLALDADRIRQIVLNFISNAIKFTERGTVVVRASYDPSDRLTIRVQDTGPGIPEDKQGRLFQRFSQVDDSSTRRYSGTGLGLAISKGLVEAMGGTIGFHSRVGEGSQFWFSVPAPLGEQGVGFTVASHSPLLAGCRILVADDSELNRKLVAGLLAPFDHEIVEATDGEDAVRTALARPFDLILLDLRMPVLDGIAAARRIRATPGPNRGIPILAFSTETAATCDACFDGWLAKPVTASGLIEAVGAAVGRYHSGAIHAA